MVTVYEQLILFCSASLLDCKYLIDNCLANSDICWSSYITTIAETWGQNFNYLDIQKKKVANIITIYTED